jgi:hypothetical protein
MKLEELQAELAPERAEPALIQFVRRVSKVQEISESAG